MYPPTRDRRASRRINVEGANYETVLLGPSGNRTCSVVDFSSAGLRFKVTDSSPVPETGRLEFRGMTFDYRVINENVSAGEHLCGVSTTPVQRAISETRVKYTQLDKDQIELSRRIWKRRSIAIGMALVISLVAGRVGLIKPFVEDLVTITGGVKSVGENTAVGVGNVAGNIVEGFDKVNQEVTPWIASEAIKLADEYVEDSIRSGNPATTLSPEQALKQLEDLADRSESRLEEFSSFSSSPTTSNSGPSEKFTTFSFSLGRSKRTNSSASAAADGRN